MHIAFGVFYAVLTLINLNSARVLSDADRPLLAAAVGAMALVTGFVSGLFFGGVL